MASATSTATKRKSDPIGPKPKCVIHPSAIIADKAQITGTHQVTIGESAVLHPHAQIRSYGGSVTIGKHTMVYEGAIIGAADERDVIIGDYVNIESGANVEAKRVGNGTEVGIKAVIGPDVDLGAWCKIGPLGRVGAGEVLADNTVVYGDRQSRENTTVKEHEAIQKAKMDGQEKAVELMRRLIPNGAAKWAG